MTKQCNGCGVNEISAYETALAFAERTVKRLWILIIILSFMLLGTNIAWIVYESQFDTISEDESYTISQETEGGDNYSVIGDGYINGEADD